ncbi:protein KINESIN LIGHT CHAIN-RELATED 2-like [Corylus avellana]|uniref:protein KINESIN LIGHT CHAIN-RELATED 2-like n=1 Tax=Corylus avellana TaxID=13451 RepID=UPI00286D4EEE|nr:protein KINESIN LIGHT CHAIN-RELATED 2-like [Corylus avellana]
MRKASISLLSQLSRQKLKSFAPLLSRNYVSNPSSFSSSPLISPTHPSLKSCAKTHGLLFNSNQFRTKSVRKMETLVEKPDQLSSGQGKMKEKSELEKAFESAETTEEIIKAFQEMESDFDEKELGMYSWRVAAILELEEEDPEKILSFANRALKVFEKDNQLFSSATVLFIMGSANCRLKRFASSLEYLNRASRVLDRYQPNDDDLCCEDFGRMLFSVQCVLVKVKLELGRTEEALELLRKCVEFKEEMLEKDSSLSRKVGLANRDLAQLYFANLDFEEALPYCLRALEIHEKHLEQNSVDVACARRLLGVIYSVLEEHEKALEQNELSRKVLSNWGQSSDLIDLEILSANVHIALGKYETAINTLRGVVEMTDEDSLTRASVFISMGKALHLQEKIEDSKRCLEIACGILDKKETASPEEVVEAYVKIAMQYESMEEFETAISLLKRPVAFLQKHPHEQPSKGKANAIIGWLLLMTDKLAEAIPHLELAASSLKESYGPKHIMVGYIYNNLGVAYLMLDSRHGCISWPSAAETFAVAKDIIEESLGPHLQDSIMACQNLATAYDFMGSYDLAIEFLQRTIDGMERYESGAEDCLRHARRRLEQVKKKSRGEPLSIRFSTNVFPLRMPYP